MYRPKIIGFACNWSLPAGMNVINNSRIGHPKIHFVQLMCVGRIDPAIVLETFAKGADGILVVGCHPPDCHYGNGNLEVERKIKMLRNLLPLAGLESERLRLEWAYATETKRFARIINNFRNLVMTLGPSTLAGQQSNPSMLLNIKAAKAAMEGFRLRVLIGRERELTEEENVYGEKIAPRDFDALYCQIIQEEFIRHKIQLLTKGKAMSVKEIAAIINIKSALVLRHLVNMRRKGMVALHHVRRTTPFYKALEAQ